MSDAASSGAFGGVLQPSRLVAGSRVNNHLEQLSPGVTVRPEQAGCLETEVLEALEDIICCSIRPSNSTNVPQTPTEQVPKGQVYFTF